MHIEESRPLLPKIAINNNLSLFFAIICVVDVFGVFPIVTLPKPIIDCVFVVCSVQIYTATLLGKCWTLAEEIRPSIKLKNRYPYSALAELTFGKCTSYYVTFLVDLTVFSGGIPNLIVAAQNLQLLGLRVSDLNISFCYWIIVLGAILCPVLWLGSPKDMKILCTISVIIVSTVYLLICACLLFAPTNEIVPKPNDTSLWRLIISAYGIVAFQFDIHPSILTIQMDMCDKRQLPQAILGGFLVSLFMFGSSTLIAALKYGNTANPSILETLPTSVALHFAATLVAVQLCLTSAVSNNALYQHMEDFLNISREFNHKRCILRTILTFLAIVIAESVPRFDLVMSLIGGTLIGPLVFILPPLFYVKIVRMHTKHLVKLEKESFTNVVMNKPSKEDDYTREYIVEQCQMSQTSYYISRIWNRKLEVALCILIIVAGTLMTCVTTYLNVNSAALSYQNFSRPCIYNVSRALLYL
ncbi:unnamed protein product [Ceutorhynchus assimilis]|uniref:Amino acid transporter transmembrane domain-containing protein n=1 Tax=Ceutorhynchus assimilis TaxID=467358 RepID=A0A9N9MZ21_9CUCU|nr:unnamed protein product [Ceutorhynchus assimilis]